MRSPTDPLRAAAAPSAPSSGALPAPADLVYRAFWRPYVRSHRLVPSLLGARVIHAEWPGHRADVMLGWGRKRAGAWALDAARNSGRPWLLAEDGFLRSIGLGPDDPGLSIVLDDIGIYYDATVPSRLEALVTAPQDSAAAARAEALAAAWRAARVSKYNAAREALRPVAGDYVLAVDQTAADSSITYGLADAGSFHRMLEAALDEHPGTPIVLKVHPDVIAGRKRGHFEQLTPGQSERVLLLADDAHPPGLVEPARAVYVVTSQMGFEALLWDRPVRCFGMPFYAGWGLTADALPAPQRRRPAPLTALVHAALIGYARYLDPETGQRCEVERLLEWMALQRRQRTRWPERLQVIGFRDWKRPVARAFFQGAQLDFLEPTESPAPGLPLVVWGRAPAPDVPTQPAVVRIEDGFLRSVGLGAHLVHPLSWVIDRQGMYYDAGAPSELETLLATTTFDDALRARAARLRQRIVELGVTKYNVGHGRWTRPAGASRVVLVPGQVESDASIAYGTGTVRSNAGLLAAVRAAAPEAFIVYKPHPDVMAKMRHGDESTSTARSLFDAIVVDVPMHALLEQVDEVHTLTSLAGFEALLRGRRVVCHGAPFYAGWGLTEDHVALPRRGRRLTLDELVAATLILYPTYVSRTTGRYTTPERAVDELLAWRQRDAGIGGRLRAWARPITNRWVAWRGK